MRKCAVIPLVVICALFPAAAWGQLPPAYCTQWGSEGSEPGQFEYPYGVAVGSRSLEIMGTTEGLASAGPSCFGGCRSESQNRVWMQQSWSPQWLPK